MQRFLGGRILGAAVSLVAVSLITFFYARVLRVNQTTVALSFLLAILAVSAVWGMVVSAFMSVVATVAFNYFFLPPIGTLTIADPQNWVALFAFLVTSITGSQFSTRIRKEALAANQRRREVERLYRFSRQLLGEGNVIQLMNAIPDYIVESFEAGAAELFLPQKDKFYRSGFGASHLDDEKMKSAFLRDEMTLDAEHAEYFVPVRMGVRPIASLGISGAPLSKQSIEAIGSMVAIAIERARAVEQLGQTEAERQGERLKSALLDSITHDFRTPLTSMKAAVTGLLTSCNSNSSQSRELLTIINEEADRLNQLAAEVIAMARVEAGKLHLEKRSVDVAELIGGAMAELGARAVTVDLERGLPAAA